MDIKLKKNGVVSSNAFSDSIPIQDMRTTVLSDNSVWALIFEHNCQGGTVLFSSYSEVMNTQTANKYSRLNILDKFKGSDGKFEFMLCYPDDTTDYNRWKQTNNPCKEYKGTDDSTLTADGYEAISIAWTGSYWGGLARQNSDKTDIRNCYLSGSVGSTYWFYAIGVSATYMTGMPSWTDTGYASTAGRVQLWVRTDNVPGMSNASFYKDCITAHDFIEI